jgi:hypothetical protein
MVDAVNIARHLQIKTVGVLRARLLEKGYAPEVVQQALVTWANYERGKNGN